MRIASLARNAWGATKSATNFPLHRPPDCGQPDWWRRTLALGKRLLQFGRRGPGRLRLCESLPLGDHRFVAVVEFEQARFLLGGTPASLVLLARLERSAAESGKVVPSEPVAAILAPAARAEPSC
jgi:hypothetical protein